MTKHQLEQLIEKYFEGETTLEEEQTLRKELARTCEISAAIDEARAVMGYSLVQKGNLTVRKYTNIWRKVAASAAAIAVFAVIGVQLSMNRTETPECIAYIDGQKITDSEMVVSMMLSGLSNVAQAAEASQSQTLDSFENLASAMEQFDTL